jgi:hypothetical protein
MLENINSGNDYAQILIDAILKTEREIPENEQMPIELLTLWVEGIQEAAEKSYLDYVTGERETFLLSDIEMKDLFEKAGEKYVVGLLNIMVDDDVLETYIDEEGDMLYGLTDKGKQMTIDEIIDKNEDNNKQ